VTFTGVGTCTVDANQAANGTYEAAPQKQQSFSVKQGAQTIAFTSTAPNPATVSGPTYEVTTTGGASGNPVVLSIDASSKGACTIVGSIVSFAAVGKCMIDANQGGSANYEAAQQKQQSFAVLNSQTVTFTSTPPSNATVGGTSYEVKAKGGASGNPVEIKLDGASTGCAMSHPKEQEHAEVFFVGAGGRCVIDANQAGAGEYAAALQAQQSFTVTGPTPQVIEVTPQPNPGSTGPGPKPGGGSGPNSSFKVVAASLSLSTFAIAFQESVADPGTFTWVMTFENGKFGVYAAKTKGCKAGLVRLKRKCRPSKILFAKGSQTVATAGSVTFTVKPTASGIAAMKKAFKRHKGLPVAAVVKFQSARGGQPVTHVQSLIVKGRR
jgi:hypothetical protein